LWKAQKVFRVVIIGIGPRLVKKPGKATWDHDKIKSYANIFNSARCATKFLGRLMMIHYTCFKCKRRFELDPIFVGYELSKLKKKNPSHYQAVCPACRAVNKVSISAMKAELDGAADDIQKMIAEAEAEKQAEAEKKAEAEPEKAEEQGGKGAGEKKSRRAGKN
jgi:hypothetical protein